MRSQNLKLPKTVELAQESKKLLLELLERLIHHHQEELTDQSAEDAVKKAAEEAAKEAAEEAAEEAADLRDISPTMPSMEVVISLLKIRSIDTANKILIYKQKT